jgi:hypothetical protein
MPVAELKMPPDAPMARRIMPGELAPAPADLAEKFLIENGRAELWSVLTTPRQREIGTLLRDPITFMASSSQRDIFANEKRRYGPLDESEMARVASGCQRFMAMGLDPRPFPSVIGADLRERSSSVEPIADAIDVILGDALPPHDPDDAESSLKHLLQIAIGQVIDRAEANLLPRRPAPRDPEEPEEDHREAEGPGPFRWTCLPVRPRRRRRERIVAGVGLRCLTRKRS